MKEGLAKFVLCTSTLAQCVNLPIRYLVISGTFSRYGENSHQGFSELGGQSRKGWNAHRRGDHFSTFHAELHAFHVQYQMDTKPPSTMDLIEMGVPDASEEALRLSARYGYRPLTLGDPLSLRHSSRGSFSTPCCQTRGRSAGGLRLPSGVVGYSDWRIL